MFCPKCGSDNVSIQTFQETTGSVGGATTVTTIKKAKHGVAYWLFVGWWFWIIKAFLWIVAFPFMLIVKLLKKKKYQAVSQTATYSKNNIRYKTLCTCQSCGNQWEKND